MGKVEEIMERALVAHDNPNNLGLIDRQVLIATERLWERVSGPLFDAACDIAAIGGTEAPWQTMRRKSIEASIIRKVAEMTEVGE